MKLIRIHLYLQRPATRSELAEYKYFQDIFDNMGREERERNQIRRPVDLMTEKVSARNVVYYGSRYAPMYNEIFTAPVEIETGTPGANEEYRRAFAELMRDHIGRKRAKPVETFYIVGEFDVATTTKSGRVGHRSEFRTITARTEIPLRHLRRRNAFD